jgi:hypothetical protein
MRLFRIKIEKLLEDKSENYVYGKGDRITMRLIIEFNIISLSMLILVVWTIAQ